jgi:hypothetical protein
MSKTKYIILGIGIGAILPSLLMIWLYQKPVSAEKQTTEQIDTVYLEREPEIQIERVVEKVSVPANDTIMLLTNINQNVDSGDYVVLRDKLLTSRSVSITQKNKSEQANPSDVLVDRISSDNFFSEKIIVEFWESPIDYQGYRLNKMKLILFGINPNDYFELSNTQEGFLLMNSGGQSAILYPTEKYRTFIFQ